MFVLLATPLLLLGQAAASPAYPLTLTPGRLDSHIANIHLTPTSSIPAGKLTITHGSCISSHPSTAHHTIASSILSSAGSRVVWRIPEDSQNEDCISAWSEDNTLVGRSAPVDLSVAKGKLRKKRALESIKMNNETGFDVYGQWFDGVTYLKGKTVSVVDVKKAKAKKIAIVGAGTAGLMVSLLLKSVGFTNWEVIEGNDSVGGRIRTKYLEGVPEDNQYQEMGPMRFPWEATYGNETLPVNDHRIVFQLVDTLNKLNAKKNPELKVDFIPFIQNHPNIPRYMSGIRNDDGSIPTVSEAAEDPRFNQVPANPEVTLIGDAVNGKFFSTEMIKGTVTNMYKIHKKYIAEGLDHFSEFYFVHGIVKASLDAADQTSQLSAGPASAYWTTIADIAYFTGTTFRTIRGGLNRIGGAFVPHLKGRLTLGRRITALSTANGKTTLTSRPSPLTKKTVTTTHDYTILALPFTELGKLRLPALTPLHHRAINNLNYISACKVALQFKRRFWERDLQKPIFGGCGSTDVPGIGNFCYPSFGMNSTGPGVMLASYIFGDEALRHVSLKDEEHVGKVLDAVEELHGSEVDVRGLWTGKYDRVCWVQEEGASGGWAEPHAGQHEMYLPAYFETVDGVIMVGEHTGYVHGWIAAALESAVRGAVQLCLELGLVEEAKEIVDTWMARWITV